MQWPARLFQRKPDAHKADFGHVFILAGSMRYSGAACLCANAAIRAGAGLVTLGIPEGIYDGVVKRLVPEVMVLPLAQSTDKTLSLSSFNEVKKFLKKVQCLLIGPGLTQHVSTQALIRKTIGLDALPMVVDADALNALAGYLGILKKLKNDIVLTPHPGEMARLEGVTSAAVQSARKKVAKDFALRYNKTLILKGFRTIVASSGEETYVNKTGNPGMATAGCGDVLSGIVAAFLGQGMPVFEAARWGVYLHGLAGDLAARDKTQVGLIASDIIEYLPKALKKMEEGKNGFDKAKG